jgi:hypothetical protein
LVIAGRKEIVPKRDVKAGQFTFSDLAGYEIPKPKEILEDLTAHGLFSKHLFDTIPICPQCGSRRYYLQYVCPFSGHHSLQKGTLIEHYHCGKIDLLEKFAHDHELICPKCQRELKIPGTDYRRIDNIFTCTGCLRYFAIPSIEVVCHQCGRVSKLEELSLEPVFSYKFNDDLQNEVVANCLFQEPILKFLEDRGYMVESPKFITGESGVQHLFDIVAKKGDETIVISVESDEVSVGPESVISYFVRIFDVKPSRSILVAMPSVSPQARSLASLYRIELIEGETISDLLSAFAKLFQSSAERPVSPQERMERVSLTQPEEMTTAMASRNETSPSASSKAEDRLQDMQREAIQNNPSLSEIITIKRTEWESFNKDTEVLMECYKRLQKMSKDLAKQNADLRNRLRLAEEKNRVLEAKLSAESEDATEAIQQMRANISRVLVIK